jgi:hypothetical protein
VGVVVARPQQVAEERLVHRDLLERHHVRVQAS